MIKTKAMNTKVLMIASSTYLGVSGLILTFLPEETASYHGISNPLIQLVFQIMGSMYLGFAMLNWMMKNNLIGGIYGRPLVLGNFVHFFVSTFALVKVVQPSTEGEGLICFLMASIYLVFTLSFGYLIFNSPTSLSKTG